jgi:hypothetical protein
MAIESMNRNNTEFDMSKMVSAKLWSANLLYDGIYTFSDAFETNTPALFQTKPRASEEYNQENERRENVVNFHYVAWCFSVEHLVKPRLSTSAWGNCVRRSWHSIL